LLIGESANQPVVMGIREMLQIKDNIEAVIEVEECIVGTDRDIKNQYPRVQRIFI